jgi:hypothetical protein
MGGMGELDLRPRLAGGGTESRAEFGWRLCLPAGLTGAYRLAQLDDYGTLSRKYFLHSPPITLRLRIRVSSADLPGTWGFGLWNDPFGFSLGFGGKTARIPALPQTAWFMHASPPNWLSLQDDQKTPPANGFFAGAFRSPPIPSLFLLPGLLAFPLCAIRPFSRLLRGLAGRIIRQDATSINEDVTLWHEYSVLWERETCTFHVDGNEILQTPWSPLPPLGLVIWIDNQYAGWTPDGKPEYGTLANPAAWLEIERLKFRQEK